MSQPFRFFRDDAIENKLNYVSKDALNSNNEIDSDAKVIIENIEPGLSNYFVPI